jgi:hypothetical protein
MLDDEIIALLELEVLITSEELNDPCVLVDKMTALLELEVFSAIGELVEALVLDEDSEMDAILLDEETTSLLVLEPLTADEDGNTTAPALEAVELAELDLVLVTAFAVEAATTELTRDLIDSFVVDAGTEEDLVPTTEAAVETDAGDQKTAGV